MSRAAARLETGVETGLVTALSHEGAGIIPGGKTAFVPGALPGETVRFRRLRRRRQYDEAALAEVVQGVACRVVPRCAHFGLCGGCALQHMDSAAQLAAKQQQLQDSLARLGGVSPQEWLAPIAGPTWAYRRRARLGVKYVARKGRVLVGFRERWSNLVAALDACEVLAEPAGRLIEPLAALVMQLAIRERLPQIEVAVGDNAVALVLRVLDPPTAPDEQLLRAFAVSHNVRIFLQTGGPRTVRPLDEAPPLRYALPEFDLQLQFEPSDFIQVNAEINRRLVARAVELLQLDGTSRVLDLYCGLGNFTLALGRRAGAACGVEGDPGLVERARGNAELNGLDNVEFHCADLDAQPPAGTAWAVQPFTHVLLDPPRVGARELLPLIARLRPARLLYVSCHPGSLARDLGLLVHDYGFVLRHAGVVDMFPHTAHVESLALLTT